MFWMFVEKGTEAMLMATVSEKDAEDLARELADLPVMPNGTSRFRDLWEARTTAILLPTEMGEHKTVAWNRFALLGDSVHKQTISAGQGGNLCMESAAALTNVLKDLLDMLGRGAVLARVGDVVDPFVRGPDEEVEPSPVCEGVERKVVDDMRVR